VIPPQSVEQTWVDYDSQSSAGVPELSANYPIVTKDQQYGLFHEVATDWHDQYAVWAAFSGPNIKPQYTGDVWSIQLTARPGYYVTPQQLENYGLMDHDVPPLG